jgi:hypothetical protein
VTAQDTRKRQAHAAAWTVTLDRLHCIVGAGRKIPAAGSDERADRRAIHPYQADQQFPEKLPNHFHQSCLLRGAAGTERPELANRINAETSDFQRLRRSLAGHCG